MSTVDLSNLSRSPAILQCPTLGALVASISHRLLSRFVASVPPMTIGQGDLRLTIKNCTRPTICAFSCTHGKKLYGFSILTSRAGMS